MPAFPNNHPVTSKVAKFSPYSSPKLRNTHRIRNCSHDTLDSLTSQGTKSVISSRNVSQDSLTGISLEFDDFPLDLVSTVVTNQSPEHALPIHKLHCTYKDSLEELCENVWKPPSLDPQQDKKNDRILSEGMITDYGRRSWCDYPQNVDTNNEVFVNYRASLAMTESGSTVPQNHENINEEQVRLVPNGDATDHREYQTRSILDRFICKSCFRKCSQFHQKPTCNNLVALKTAFSCISNDWIADVLTRILFVILLWTLAIALEKDKALPGGFIFALFCVYITAAIGGWLATLCKLPAGVGMLLAVLVLNNGPTSHFFTNSDHVTASFVRKIAVTVLGLQMGFNIHLNDLKSVTLAKFQIFVLPGILETIAVMILCRFCLSLPWMWSLLIGYLLSSTDMGTVLNKMCSFQKVGLGTGKDIPHTLTQSSVIENIVVLVSFTLSLGICSSQNNGGVAVIWGMAGLVLAVIFPLCIGLIISYLPRKSNKHHNSIKISLLALSCCVMSFGSDFLGCFELSLLGCIVLAAVSNIAWQHQGTHPEKNPMRSGIKTIWNLTEPFLFGLVASEIKITRFSILGLTCLVIVGGIGTRLLGIFLCTIWPRTNFNMKERIFIQLASMHRGAFQVALSVLILEQAAWHIDSQEYASVKQACLCVVLLILIVTPVSIWLSNSMAEKLLQRSSSCDAEIGKFVAAENSQECNARIAVHRNEITTEFETVT